MTRKDIITGSDIEINVRNNASPYEIGQEIVRQSARTWIERTNNKKLTPTERLHDVRMFEKYAYRYGLQRELREIGII